MRILQCECAFPTPGESMIAAHPFSASKDEERCLAENMTVRH
jgi:hypothetical protein